MSWVCIESAMSCLFALPLPIKDDPTSCWPRGGDDPTSCWPRGGDDPTSCWPHDQVVGWTLPHFRPSAGVVVRKKFVFSHNVQSAFIFLQGKYLRPNPKKNMVYGTLELTITSAYVHSRVDSNTFTTGKPMPESTLTLRQSRLFPPVRDIGFGLRKQINVMDEKSLSLFP